jgi:hypothetical protein
MQRTEAQKQVSWIDPLHIILNLFNFLFQPTSLYYLQSSSFDDHVITYVINKNFGLVYIG